MNKYFYYDVIRWEPKEDITVFELAKCSYYFQMSFASIETIVKMPKSCQRHWKITKRRSPNAFTELKGAK